MEFYEILNTFKKIAPVKHDANSKFYIIHLHFETLKCILLPNLAFLLMCF